MAIEFIQDGNRSPIPAYDDNIIEIKTDSTATGDNEVIGIKIVFTYNNEFIMETYSPVFFKTAVFNMKNIYPSLLDDYVKPTQRTSETGVKFINPDSVNRRFAAALASCASGV
jgi:hypothetical protein